MKIAVDLRSLNSGGISGVENYIVNLLEHLLPSDSRNNYTLFHNALGGENLTHLQFLNAKEKSTRLPNKLLNLSVKFFAKPKFEQLIGDFDSLFLPNLNHFALGPKKKLVVTVHDLSPVVTPEFYDARRRFWHSFLGFKKTLERANLILAVSNFTKQDLMTFFKLPETKIKVVYPGIDHSLFHPNLPSSKLREIRNLYNLPGDFILYLSTVEPRKNLIGLIEAFEQIKNPVSLVIAGKLGWKYQKTLEKMKQSLKARDIKYLGYIPENDKPYIIKLARAVVYPSFYEGFGFVPLEAMSVGTPVVTSQVTSLPEVVEDSALLINPYNIDDLAKALEEVLSNNKLRESLINKGLARSQKFNWQTTARETLAYLNTLQ